MSGPEQEADISSVFAEGIVGLAELAKLGEVVREGSAETVGDADGRFALEGPDDTDGTDDGDADNVGYAEAVGPGVGRLVHHWMKKFAVGGYEGLEEGANSVDGAEEGCSVTVAPVDELLLPITDTSL